MSFWFLENFDIIEGDDFFDDQNDEEEKINDGEEKEERNSIPSSFIKLLPMSWDMYLSSVWVDLQQSKTSTV